MFLLFDNGELFKVSVGQDTAKVEESYDIWKTLDSGKHQFKQSPCVIKFFPMVPPRCDS